MINKNIKINKIKEVYINIIMIFFNYGIRIINIK